MHPVMFLYGDHPLHYLDFSIPHTSYLHILQQGQLSLVRYHLFAFVVLHNLWLLRYNIPLVSLFKSVFGGFCV